MAARERVVFDTNALVGRLLLPHSIPGRAVRKAVEEAEILVCEPLLDELAEVLARPKFDPYVTVADRQRFLRLLGRIAEIVPIVHTVRECRDPRDDKVLELAVNGRAEVIVSGDADLLVLDPFRGIPILAPARYLARG